MPSLAHRSSRAKLASLALFTAFAPAGAVQAQITPILPPNYYVTGVRQNTGGDILLTGGPGAVLGTTPAFLYNGPLNAIPSNPSDPSLHYFHAFNNPNNGSEFYGPNTALFNPAIGAGNVTAVGAYQTSGTSFQNGMMYQGPLDGSGAWTLIKPPDAGNLTVNSTIAHSTMGNLVVGNFDYNGQAAQGLGFIYNITNQTYKTIEFGLFSTTAYGIWQNGGASSTHYTIVGGLSDLLNGGEAYIVNYNSTTETFSHLTKFTFNNQPSLVTHFEGISAVDGGFSIAAMTLTNAAYAFIPMNEDGSFGSASWIPIVNDIDPDAATTGNTILDYTLFGVYTIEGGGANSYLSTVPEPAAVAALAGLGALALVAGARRRVRAA